MSLSDDILEILSSYSGGYKLMRRRMLGYEDIPRPPKLKKSSDETIQVTLSRLKKRGFVENDVGSWFITRKGLDRLVKVNSSLGKRSRNKNTKNMIIAFDVPESMKSKRDWLRLELISLGFSMLQRSVWFGPAPIPKEFISSLNDLKLLPCMKFFDAKESDII